MKYKRLPIEAELLAITNDNERSKVRSAAFLEVARMKGFQLVTGILRTLESRSLNALRCGLVPDDKIGRVLGRLENIEEIRRSLTSLLPESEQPHVDWFDSEEEAFVNVDETLPTDDE